MRQRAKLNGDESAEHEQWFGHNRFFDNLRLCWKQHKCGRYSTSRNE
jgi:hypothetical protein